ncbi:MAG: GDP-fucose synthetase, partial [Gammaproteobacteria bacterium]|nr:GDP-fucose synthetase [Gammaproteobacteria bacterium]
ELAETLQSVIGFEGELVFDQTKPDGMLRKCLDVSLLRKLGWESKIGFREGIEQTYKAYLVESANA